MFLASSTEYKARLLYFTCRLLRRWTDLIGFVCSPDLPACGWRHHSELSLSFVGWVLPSELWVQTARLGRCRLKVGEERLESLQIRLSGVFHNTPLIYCLVSQINQDSFACFFDFDFLFLSFCLFVFVCGCILSPLSLPSLSLISNKINAIILWIPQDSFGEKKNNKTLKNQINEQKYKLKSLCCALFAFLFVFQ